ncbi:MAG: response regulator [Candidatus Aminicenantes bacterium]|nr:response regulator [Candidatus Aminicenantes bacterium]
MSKPLRVLIVEDSEDDALLAVQELKTGGYDPDWLRVETAEDMKAALHERKWDVILSDYKMPHFDAPAALAVLQDSGLDLPFIVVSGVVGEDVAVEVMKAGAHDFFLKENLTRLAAAIEREMREAENRCRRKAAEEERDRHYRNLTERVKELKCLFNISNLAVRAHKSLDETLQATVDLIPPGMQYPEITCARITFEGREFATANFKETPWTLSADISTSRSDSEVIGSLLICYLEHKTDADEGPFFREERHLVNDIARQLGILIEREKAEQALRESEKGLKEAQRLASIGNWLWNLDTGELTLSDEMYDIIGLKRNTKALDFARHEKCYTPESWRQFQDAVETARKTGEPYEIELEVIRENKPNRQVVARGVPLKDGEGKIFGLRGTLQDITEHRLLDAQLRQAQKMESIGRLAGGVAHDFNNMLSIIMGNAEFVLNDLPEGSPQCDSIVEILKTAQRSTDLTRQLLAFARQQAAAPMVIDLNKTVEGILRMLHRIIGENIDLLWKPCRDIEPLCIDPAQIDQILANLCVNARDAIGPNVGKITIETGKKSFNKKYCTVHPGFIPGEYVLLAVSDDGCGMDRETQEKIFEPFFTTKEVGKGTGLGLATVYGMIRQNKGFIKVYSEPGQGTTFNIYLPPSSEKGISPPAIRTNVSVPRGHETILLVEDERSILKMAKKMLERLGYTALIANSPTEAVRIAKKHAGEIHLLITDVIMPEMHGNDLAKKLKTIHPAIKCLFMSGYMNSIIAQRGVLDDDVNFIQKPFSQRDLGFKVNEALGKE